MTCKCEDNDNLKRYEDHLHLLRRFCEVVRKMKDLSPKWIALGGGGYEITNVAKAWTLAWAIMNNIDPPDKLPEAFFKQYPLGGSGAGSSETRNIRKRGRKKR